MSLNADIAGAFHEIAVLLELTGADTFRVRAHQRAARAIEGLTTDIAELSRKDLLALDGVGHKTVDKIEEFVGSGTIGELEKLREAVPPGLAEILKIPGLGPKTVRALWKTLGVETVDALRESIADGSILTVPRMGQKTVDNIVRALDFSASSGGRTPAGIAVPLAELVIEHLRAVPGVTGLTYAGSLRRGCETAGDIDILACAEDPEAAGEAFRTMPGVTDVLAAGSTKSSVRMSVPAAHGGPDGVIQVDLRVVPEDSYGAALMYFTGSKEHNVRLRERARARGMTLNEYGLFPGEPGPQSRGVAAVASAREEDIYEALGLPMIPPELREDRGELDLTRTPRLLETGDIRAELHAHTTASDGVLSIEELALEAKRRGFHTIAVTDHSKSQTVANGLSPERLVAHIAAVRAVNDALEGITVLAGSEVDIMPDGNLDYDDDLLAQLDVVVASPHWSLQQKPAKATERLLRAIRHPLVHIIGHPTGRLINKRSGLEPDLGELFAAAHEHGVAMEINAHWKRLDLRDVHVRAAVEAGVLIAVDCDAHSAENFDNLVYGVRTGRRGWLPPEQCVNTWDAPRLMAWLTRKRATSSLHSGETDEAR